MISDLSLFDRLSAAPRAVFDALEARGDRVRFRVADTGETVTWRAYAEQIESYGHALLALGLRPGERAAVFGDNSVAWAAASLAVQAVGGVLVPIYGASTADQVEYIVNKAQIRVLFTDVAHASRLPAMLPTLGLDAPDTWEPLASLSRTRDPGAVRAAMDAIDLDRPGLMLFTSGTTGHPKGVPLTHRNVAVNGRDWLRSNAPALTLDAESDLLWLPMSHIFGFGELCLGNTLGFETTLCSPAQVLDQLPRVRPTVFMSVPSLWEKLARLVQDEAPSEVRARRLREATGGRLHFCLSGGAGLKQEVKIALREHGLLVLEGYGLTEASPTLTLNRLEAYRFDSVGQPLASVRVRLAADGEILAAGESIFAGYHEDPEATAAAFELADDGTRWLKTGDVGEWTEDGFLRIVDRKKDILVTSGGKNVPPQNIELRFQTDPVIQHLVVYGDGKPYLVAGVWVHPGAPEAAIADRIAAVNATLARHETIKRFVVVDVPLSVEAGLLTSTLKVRRKAVYERFRAQFEALYA